MTDKKTNSLGNLDIECAELGRELANINSMDDKALNEALTVLEQQGPYAMFLYMKATYNKKSDGEPIFPSFDKECQDFLRKHFPNFNGDDSLKIIESLAGDLHKLLFAKDLLRTALSYARFHLKAKNGSK